MYGCVPVVAQINSVGIQHRDYFEDDMIPQDLSHWMLAHQEVDHTYQRRKQRTKKILKKENRKCACS